ncbi:exodeoxyribonuclease VII [Alkanindiges hydrocarboniclasticus]|jgi:exodeoxyribonuclease VII small subunit|uniref:Exodeoxyribonuclease VII n=1 Tax=Alkanindiges hydrocarboniclasticus TaxID=1907941 RepID=A0A1S8CY41_9GAMM|nr:exodeoxyribonuclease VII small subunit [Alkanindiges hydrocarboniclasticus]ONG42267.1 exodeoxyribonuclease VII [Alkanindiges hydrocarboniclasticus]
MTKADIKSSVDHSTLDFKQAFAVLKQNAERLEAQQEPDLDQLMVIVEESMQAYKVCKQRIKAVQDALNQTFEHD